MNNYARKRTRAIFKEKPVTDDYPWESITLAVLIIFLSPFTSYYINAVAFLICFFRAVRYGAVIFSTDYCILATVSLLFQLNSSFVLLPYLCLAIAIWFVCTEGLQPDAATIMLIVWLDYLLLRTNGDFNNLVLCFSQFALLRELLKKQNRSSAVRTSKLYCISLLISSLYAYIFRSTSQLIALKGTEAPAYWMSTQKRFYGLFQDPNYYMALLIIAITLLIKLRLSNEIKRIPFVAMLSAVTVFGFLTYSKTFLLLIAFICVVYVILQIRNRRFFLSFALTVGILLTVMVSMQIQDSPLQVILYRFSTATNMDDLTTGRSDLYGRYTNAIISGVKSFFIGYGLDAEYLTLSPHNLYLEILYYLGAFGMAIYVATLGAFIHVTRSERHQNRDDSFLMRYFPLISIAILFFSLSGMFSPSTYVMIFLALVSMLI